MENQHHDDILYKESLPDLTAPSVELRPNSGRSLQLTASICFERLIGLEETTMAEISNRLQEGQCIVTSDLRQGV